MAVLSKECHNLKNITFPEVLFEKRRVSDEVMISVSADTELSACVKDAA